MAETMESTVCITDYFEGQPWLNELLATPWLDGNAVVIQQLNGTINHNVQLRSGDQDYFLKCFADAPLSLNRQRQFTFQQWLAEKQLTPQVLFLDSTAQVQLEQWFPHQLHPQAVCDVPLLAAALGKLHNTSVDDINDVLLPLDLPAVWALYIETSHTEVDEQLSLKIEQYTQYWQKQSLTVLGHHDLHAQHILSDDPLMMIDFEYAALSTAAYDLASTVVANHLSDAEIQLLCECYSHYNSTTSQAWYQQVMANLPLVNLTHKLWSTVALNNDVAAL